MTIQQLKKKINAKFGSWHNFARLVGVQALKDKSPSEIDAIARGLSRQGSEGGIPALRLEGLKTRLNAFPGGKEEFCRKHGFSLVSVHQILQGRRKRMSPVVEKLLAHFGI